MPEHPALRVARQALRDDRAALESMRQRLATTPCHGKSEYAYLPEVVAARAPGRQNLERFERALAFLQEKGGLRFGYLQLRFLHEARIALLRRMYGDVELAQDMAYLRQRFQIKRVADGVAILFPRRSGKTVVQTVLAACVAVSQPHGNVATINLYGRQARMWLSQTIRWLEVFRASPEFAYVEVQRDAREYIQIKNCTGTMARISSFPGSSDGSGDNMRGAGESLQLLNMDEFMFIKASMYPVVLPLLNNGAALIVTSSMSAGADDEIKRMIHAKLPDGADVMRRLNWISPCSQCVARGQPQRCTHLVQQPQHFQSRAASARVEALMKPFGDGAYAREMLNIQGRPPIEPAFNSAWLQPLRERAYDYTGQRDQRYFFVTVDPAGEGFSQTVMLSMGFDRQEASVSTFAPYMGVVRSSSSSSPPLRNRLCILSSSSFLSVSRGRLCPSSGGRGQGSSGGRCAPITHQRCANSTKPATCVRMPSAASSAPTWFSAAAAASPSTCCTKCSLTSASSGRKRLRSRRFGGRTCAARCSTFS